VTTSRWFATKGVWTVNGWMESALIETDEDGTILQITLPKNRENDTKKITNLNGWVVPGFINAHSHAFQYEMAGQAESKSPERPSDDFWSWRSAMYSLALRLNPDEFEQITAKAYTQMVERGITSVVEFHYLHHDPAGKPYSNRAEMCERLVAAALSAGLRITIVPILYEQSTFTQPPLPEQRRFIHERFDDYLSLIEQVNKLSGRYRHVTSGIGAHSLRGTKPENIRQLYAMAGPGRPFHMHVAEQPAEVEACKTHLGMRPVEWVLHNLAPDSRCNLVHATHMTPAEINALGKSDATVVICPSTEANLGDGIFPLIDYMRAGGRFAVGTDSQICLDPREDLRWLEYSSRLISGKRNPLLGLSDHFKTRESGDLLLRETWTRGARARGDHTHSPGGLAPGQTFDAVVIDGDHPLLANVPAEKRLSTFVFAMDVTAVAATVIGGKIHSGVRKS